MCLGLFQLMIAYVYKTYLLGGGAILVKTNGEPLLVVARSDIVFLFSSYFFIETDE
jgi:hypothetical protein